MLNELFADDEQNQQVKLPHYWQPFTIARCHSLSSHHDEKTINHFLFFGNLKKHAVQNTTQIFGMVPCCLGKLRVNAIINNLLLDQVTSHSIFKNIFMVLTRYTCSQ